MKNTILIIITAFAFLTVQGQKIKLSLNLKKGETYFQTTDSKSTVTQDFNGQEMIVVMTVKGSMSYHIKSVTKSAYQMEVMFKHLSLGISMPQGSAEFDSNKMDENDILSTVLGKMIDSPFEVLMSKTGRVLEVIGVEDLWEESLDQFKQLTTVQKEQLRAQIMKAYGEEALKGSIELVTAVFPDKRVKKSEQWSIHTKLESGMSANVNTDYKLVEINKDTYIINGQSEIYTEDKDAYVEINGMTLKYDLVGTMSSEITIDKDTGWIIIATFNQEIKGDAYIKENDQMPEGMKIPMVVVNETVIANN